MTTFPLLDCCQMLSIDPKTLRNWLKAAAMPLHDHPGDARVKCLTQEQIQQLAVLHHRAVKPPQVIKCKTATEAVVLATPVVATHGEAVALHVQSSTVLASSQVETDLLERLALLERKVALQQEQLTQLALQLLQERDQGYQRLREDLTLLFQLTLTAQEPQLQSEPQEVTEECKPVPIPPQKHLVTEECKPVPIPPRQSRRGRPVLALIEYGADGKYVVICPERGELFLTPDSPDWFEWLSTLSSFRFMGQHGRLSASRNTGRDSWMAYRRIHTLRYNHTLGHTTDLTLDHLERMAAQLQSYVPSL